MSRKNAPGARAIAKDRINELFLEARNTVKTNPSMANRYVGIARRLAMRYNLKLSKEQKTSFCKHCYHFLQPGKNLTVRRTEKGITYTCHDCNKHMRFPLK